MESSECENGLSGWYDKLRLNPGVLCVDKKEQMVEIDNSSLDSDCTDSEYDDSEDDMTKETIYTSPEDCTQQLQSWTQKIKDIDDDPFLDYYGYNKLSDPHTDSLPKKRIDVYHKFCWDTRDAYDYAWQGPSHESKPFHGRGTVTFSNGDEMWGVWNHGRRHGRFTITLQAADTNLVSIEGDFRRNVLCGNGGVNYSDGSTIVSEFKDGCLHGLARVMNSRGNIEWAGTFHNGYKTGIWWQFKEGGGVLTGKMNKEEELSGQDIIYFYPDMLTCLVGQFTRGTFVSGYQAAIKYITHKLGMFEVCAEELPGPLLKYTQSTTTFICHDLLQSDPYESKTVYVAPSKAGEGEGLFARRKIDAGTVVAFYNGIRIPPQEGDENEVWEDCSYRIFVNPDGEDESGDECSNSLDGINNNSTFHRPSKGDTVVTHGNSKWDKSQERMDIPIELRSIDRYRATLAHKVNHSFSANCDFSGYEHPLYGKIPCVVTIQEVEEGDELTCFYRYCLTDCPQWYAQLWESMGNPAN